MFTLQSLRYNREVFPFYFIYIGNRADKNCVNPISDAVE